MAQMNKRPQGVSRRSELEKDLIGDITAKKALVDSGKDRKDTPFNLNMRAENRAFQIKQGVRRRHPERVLSQFKAIVEETSNANSAWEKALMHEQERVEIPEEYKVSGGDMMTQQTGLVTTALDNFMKSKSKFERMHAAGV